MLVPIFLLTIVAGCFGAAVQNCHMNQMEKCGEALSAFRKEMGQSFPTTEDQVKQFCENMRQTEDCVEDYQNKCMTPMQLQTMGFLTEGTLDAYDEFCAEGSAVRTDYLKNAECVDAAAKTDEAKSYYAYMEAALEGLHDIEPSKKLPLTCCGHHWLTTKFNAMGAAKCGQEAMDSFQKVMDMAVSSLPSVFCSGFDSANKVCTDILPPPGATPKGTIRNSHIAKTFTSLYMQD